MKNDKNIRKGITATLFAVMMVVSVLAVVPVVSATVAVYDNDRPGWESALVCGYEEEFFTDATLNPGVSFVSDLGYVDIVDGVWWDNLICPGKTVPPWPTGPTTTEWQFANPLVGFGGKWNPYVPSGPGSRIAVEVSVQGSWVYIGEILETYENLFWGFVSTEPFDAVRLSSGSLCDPDPQGTWCEKYELDNMVYSAHDTTPPVITLDGAAVMTLECGVDTYTEPGATASDDCCITDPVSIGGDIVDTSIVGTYTVRYDVDDCSGNPAVQVTRTVIVEDTTAPVITLDGAAVMTLECGVDTYTEPGATASDDCCITDPVSIGGDIVDTSIVGTYTVTYDVDDCSGNPAVQVTRTVIVEDTTAPVITLNGAAVMTLECGVDTYTELGATASDDCCITDPVSISGDTVDTSTVGTYTVRYDVDDCNEIPAVQVTRTVIVEDNIPPVISVTVSPDTLWPPNHKMVDIVATVVVSDICDDAPSVVLTSVTSDEPDNDHGKPFDPQDRTSGDGNTDDDIQGADIGTEDYEFQLRAERAGAGDGRVYTITYTVTDASENSASAYATVEVPHDMG